MVQQREQESPGTTDAEKLAAVQDELAQARKIVEQLEHALDSRIAIEQAKGFLAASARVDLTTAFHALRRYSRDHNLRLHQVARDLVSGKLSVTIDPKPAPGTSPEHQPAVPVRHDTAGRRRLALG